MKFLVISFLILFSGVATAYPCPQGFDQQVDAQVLHSWLARFAGRFEMKGCHVEITACDPQAAGGDSVLGEVYIIDQDQREAYLPLILIPPGAAKLVTRLKASAERMHYLKVDHFYEEEFGRTEAYRLEMRLDPTGQSLSRLDLGTYSTNKKLSQPNGNSSRWYNCGASAN